MNYERDWNNQLNAARFAVECARLALPFYNGDRRSDVAAAIEIAERRANGEQIDSTIAYAVFARATRAAPRATIHASHTARVVARAARTAHAAAVYITTRAVTFASCTGVCDSEIQIVFARWVLRDLACGRELPEELRQAAGAAIVAGDEALAQELFG